MQCVLILPRRGNYKCTLMQMYHHPGMTHKISLSTVDTSGGAQVFRMIGIGEYNLQGDGKGNNPRKAVVLQVKSATGPDQYIGFNSAKGANFQNDEADDQVSIFHTRPQYPDEISQD